jgi:hypothetical protein
VGVTVDVGVAVPLAVALAVGVMVAVAGSGESVAALVDSATVAGRVTQALRLNARRATNRARRGIMGKECECGWVIAISD